MVTGEPLDIVQSLSLVTGLALAAVIYLSRPGRRQNQLLALFLFLEGLHVGGNGLARLIEDPATHWGVEAAASIIAPSTGLVYLLFLATLKGGPARLLRNRWLQGGLGLAVAGWTVWALTDSVSALITWWPLVQLSSAAFFVYGLIAAIGFHRATKPGTASHRQARAYLLAFGLRDLVLAFSLAAFALATGPSLLTLGAWGLALVVPIFHVILAYGILQTQLFEIDLKLKAGIRGSTVTGAFVGAFFLANEAIEQVLPVEGTLFGVLGAVGVALALRPVQRSAARLADRALPGVEDTPAYRQQRRIELYQAALSEAVGSQGVIGASERGRLERLRGELGLTERDHDILLGLVVDPPGGQSPEAVLAGRTVLDRYQVQERLGEGSQGEALLARDLELDEHVVLKVRSSGSAGTDALAEIQALIDLDDPHVLSLRAVEEVDGRLMLVLDLAQAGTLADTLEEGPLGEGELVRLADDLLSGLQAIHDAGLVHRDVKPSNIFQMADGRWVVGDLGIAHRLADDATVATMTTHGQPGTARYMSPEQAKGQPVDHRTDLFSAGLVLYEAATGEPLIEASGSDSVIEVRMRLAAWQGFDADARQLPGSLEDTLSRVLIRDPEDRLASADAFLAEVTRRDGRREVDA